MRVLHILDHSLPLHSGYVFRTHGILRAQRAMGFETFHLTSPKHVEGARAGIETVEGWSFFRTPSAGLGGPVISELGLIAATARRVIEAIDATAPDILHAHSPALNGVAALIARARRDVATVYEVRAFWEDAAVDHGTQREGGPRYRATRALETQVLSRADAVTTICQGLRRDILGRGVAPERVTVIPNAVTPDDFATRRAADPALLAELGLAGRTVIGFIGSFYAYEGLDLLIDAWPAIRARRPDAALLLTGGGPQDAALRDKAARLGPEAGVVFTGRVPHSDVPRYYDLIDLLAYPRKPMRLTELVTPLKPLEAMAGGRMLIASDVGGHRELIRDGETGFLFRAGSRDALAAAVERALSSRERWPAMAEAGRRFVEETRNWRAATAPYAQVYDEAIAQRHGAARAARAAA